MAVASKIRKCTTVADVGCDHGYLSAYLLQNGICDFAIDTDINEKPLMSAKETAKEYELFDKFDFRLSSGLSLIKEDECEDIAIAGMGGELIVQILKECDWVKKSGKHFVFQPMTHSEILIEYLVNNGFKILSQDIIKDEKHTYTVFDAEFCNNKLQYDRSYYYLGEIKNFKSDASQEYFKHLLRFLENKMKGNKDYSDVIKSIKEKLWQQLKIYMTT